MSAALILLIVSVALYVIGRLMQAHGRELEAHAAVARQAAQAIHEGQAQIFNAVHSSPIFNHPVLVWTCPNCNLLAFVPKECSRCGTPMPAKVPVVFALEADVITQRRPHP